MSDVEQSARLLFLLVGGERDVVTAPYKRASILDPWRCRFRRFKDDDVEPTPCACDTLRDSTGVVGYSEELEVLESGDDEILEDWSCEPDGVGLLVRCGGECTFGACGEGVDAVLDGVRDVCGHVLVFA